MTERKTVRRWWSSVTINRTEFWLTEMAEQGWALEDIQDNRFVFQKTEPQYREYFLPCLGWLYRGKVAERLSQIDILCNTRYGTDLRMRRIFVEIDVSKVNQNIAPLYQKRYRICRNEPRLFMLGSGRIGIVLLCSWGRLLDRFTRYPIAALCRLYGRARWDSNAFTLVGYAAAPKLAGDMVRLKNE